MMFEDGRSQPVLKTVLNRVVHQNLLGHCNTRCSDDCARGAIHRRRDKPREPLGEAGGVTRKFPDLFDRPVDPNMVADGSVRHRRNLTVDRLTSKSSKTSLRGDFGVKPRSVVCHGA